MKVITCIAPVNIAVIKYWGKRDENLILPLNDSLSATFSTDQMCAKTTIMASPDFKENKIWLNGKEESFDNPRLCNCLKELKKRSQKQSDLTNWNIHVCSENNFPTAAGLASSAAGYACFVFALSKLYEVEGDVTYIARQGSGSACRSIYGGWVRWHSGVLNDGSDSLATQVVSASHWPEMRMLILVQSNHPKKDSSTSGMKRSVATSKLLEYRAKHVVPERTEQMVRALKERDFESFASITMKDSNQFHSICLDTFPPIKYLNETSFAIIDLIHAYNEYRGTAKVAYTFDAGSNACLYLLEKDVPEVVSLIQEVFPTDTETVEYFRGLPVAVEVLSEDLKRAVNISKHDSGALKYIIHTQVGEGPQVLTDSEHLLNDAGLPKKLI
ncbi:hypothetical protein FQR65_LT04744 [Abscondita terminalis]|nr:hypothetical protein FQR65_LT04744 [Abscondita terminalis]